MTTDGQQNTATNEQDSYVIVHSDAPQMTAEPQKETDTQKQETVTPETKNSNADDAVNVATDNQQDEHSKTRLQRRIDRFTREKRDLERRVQELEQQLKSSSSEKTEIKVDDFDSYEEYVSALEDARAKSAIQIDIKEALDTISEFSEEGAAKYPDYFDKVMSLNVVPSTVIAIAETDNPHDVLYFLSTNKKEHDRIMSLPEKKQAVEIGRLSAKIEKMQQSPTPKTSNTPNPIAPIAGGSKTHKTLTDAQSQQEFEQMYNAITPKRGDWI